MISFPNRILALGLLIISLGLGRVYACATIVLVTSNSHLGMVHRIEANLFSQPNLHSKLVHILAENIQQIPLNNTETCLIVTIGAQALDKVLKTKTSLPILSVLCRKNIFHQILENEGYRLNDPNRPISAIYLDQPLERQLDLIACLNTDKTPVGILLGAQSLSEQDTLQKIARKKNLELTIVYVDRFENPAEVLDGLLDDTSMVLAIPDNWIYNAKTARGILLSAFHKRIPLIGYSRTFANNGALAAVYATTKQLAEQTAQAILNFLQHPDKMLPPPQYPKDFAIAVNHQVAHSLGLKIESEASLKQMINQTE